jgi:hypothetical protein
VAFASLVLQEFAKELEVGEDTDIPGRAECQNIGVAKVTVESAEHVRFAGNGGVKDGIIVGISRYDRSADDRPANFGQLADGGNAAVDFRWIETIPGLGPGVRQNPSQFSKNELR